MKKCSSVFDLASSYLTKNLAEGIKGPTINAIASSLPELFISSMFLFYFKDLNYFNLLLLLFLLENKWLRSLVVTISYLDNFIKSESSLSSKK